MNRKMNIKLIILGMSTALTACGNPRLVVVRPELVPELNQTHWKIQSKPKPTSAEELQKPPIKAPSNPTTFDPPNP